MLQVYVIIIASKSFRNLNKRRENQLLCSHKKSKVCRAIFNTIGTLQSVELFVELLFEILFYIMAIEREKNTINFQKVVRNSRNLIKFHIFK